MPNPHNRLAYAIQNGLGSLVSRIIVVVGVPLILGMGAYIGNHVVGAIADLAVKLDQLNSKVETQHGDIVGAINKIDVRLSIVETRQGERK